MVTIQEALSLALQHQRAGRPSAAADVYRRILAVAPEAARVHHLLGLALREAGCLEEAVASGWTAVRLAPDDNPARADLATSLFEVASRHHAAGRLDAAAEGFGQAAAVWPDLTLAHYNLGVMLDRLGRWEAALAAFRRAAALDPAHPNTHRNLGVVLEQLGRLDEAAAAFRQALTLQPDSQDACFGLARVLRHQDRPGEAEAVLRPTLAARPDWIDGHLAMALALESQDRPEEAIATLRHILARQPDHAAALHNLRELLTRVGRRADAVAPIRDQALTRFRRALPPPAPDAAVLLPLADATAATPLPARRIGLRPPVMVDHDHWRRFSVRFGVPADRIGEVAAIQYGAPAAGLAALPGGYVAGHHGIVLDRDRRLFAELFPDDLWLQSGEDLTRDLESCGRALRDGRVREENGAVLVATAPWSFNYYHFVTEAVPRLLMTRMALGDDRPCRVLAPVDQPFQREFLGLIGVPPDAVVPAGPDCRRFRTVYVLAPFQSTMAMRPEAVAALRGTVLPALGLDTAAAPTRRLYVSRADSARRVRNEDELVAALAPLGFEVVVCSRLPVAEQIRTFAEAAVVVGAHGANLTNTVFMAPGATVVELMPRSYIAQSYMVIANLVGLRYGMLLCDDPTPAGLNTDLRARDLVADVAGVLRLLERLAA